MYHTFVWHHRGLQLLITSSVQSNALYNLKLRPLCYKHHLVKVTNDVLEMCIRLLKDLRLKRQEFIHTSTIESNASSALGFASMLLLSTTCSLRSKLNAIGYLKRGRSHSICPALTSCFSVNYVKTSNKAVRSKSHQWAFHKKQSLKYT